MMSLLKKTVAAGAVSGLMIFAPITLRPEGLMAEGAGSIVRLNDACGQATSCVYMPYYICSTFHGNVPNYNCNTGCTKPDQPAPPGGGG